MSSSHKGAGIDRRSRPGTPGQWARVKRGAAAVQAALGDHPVVEVGEEQNGVAERLAAEDAEALVERFVQPLGDLELHGLEVRAAVVVVRDQVVALAQVDRVFGPGERLSSPRAGGAAFQAGSRRASR
jgi:hypothetical protein